MRWPLLVVLIALAVVVAGCVTSQGGFPAETTESARDPGAPPVSEFTGAIKGKITDDGLQPLAGANVTILGTDLSTTSDAAGGFLLGQLPPGKASLAVLLIGYEPAARAAEVIAGEVTEANFVLAAIPDVDPFHVTLKQAGLIGCSAHARESPTNASILTYAACANFYYYVSPELDRFRLDWDLGRVDNVSGLWAETTWQSNQPLGNGLLVWWLGYRGSLIYTMARVWGNDPIRAPVSGGDFATTVGDGKGPSCANPACHMTSFHYAWGNRFNGAYQVDVGVIFQQRYDDYATVFYYGEFPEEFTALPP